MNSIRSMVGSALLVAGLLMSAGSALAAPDDGFAAFWTQFKAAVGEGDQKAVSQMIKYPVFYNDERQEANFPLIWKGAFKPAQRKCLVSEKPAKEKQQGKAVHSIFCGQLAYYFSKDGAGWRLTEFGVND